MNTTGNSRGQDGNGDLPHIGEVWGIEGYGLEGRANDEWGLFVVSNVGGTLRAVGYVTTREATDEVRAKAVDKCLASIEKTWLATVPDTYEFDAVCRPGPWVAPWERRMGRLGLVGAQS